MSRKGSNRLNILFVSSEVSPYSKTGGLADIGGSLPRAIGRLGHRVMVVTPRYRGIRFTRKEAAPGVSVQFVRNDHYFGRNGIYGNSKGDYRDNLKRFATFCLRTLEIARELNFRPDVIHLHEWHTALVGIYLKTLLKKDAFFGSSKTLFTIHNIAYQGLFPLTAFKKLGLPAEALSNRGIQIWGKGNLMKGALVYSDYLSTVSRSYAREIQTPRHGCGLHGVLKRRGFRLEGILNGIDSDQWDPRRDRELKSRFSSKTLRLRGQNKQDLQRRFGLNRNPRTPLFAMVSRLVEQKGFDLLVAAFHRMMNLGLQLVILGTGEERYRNFFSEVQKRYRSRFAFVHQFNERLAMKLYGACDFFLMPSRFEPCGLGQLISFRYGAVPIVHKTGGLKDTVQDVGTGFRRGNGLVFKEYTSGSFLKAVSRAHELYEHPGRMQKIQKRNMSLDYSWEASAKQYETLYRKMSRR